MQINNIQLDLIKIDHKKRKKFTKQNIVHIIMYIEIIDYLKLKSS